MSLDHSVTMPNVLKTNNGPILAMIDKEAEPAYAKLEGEDLSYYVRSLSVSLGRNTAKAREIVDIPLTNTKSVSREHAQLFYNFSCQRFELKVLGKNGAFVDEQFVEKGSSAPLENRAKIQIGEKMLVFFLPKASTNSRSKPKQVEYISRPHQLQKMSSQLTASNSFDEGVHAKDMKPPYSYAALIAQAIAASAEEKLTLNDIYKHIALNHPYYQMTNNGWQNSVRHNLSLNKAFIKIPRNDLEPGKGAFWAINPDADTRALFTSSKKHRKSPATAYLSDAETPRKRAKKESSVQTTDLLSEHVAEDEEPVAVHCSTSDPTNTKSSVSPVDLQSISPNSPSSLPTLEKTKIVLNSQKRSSTSPSTSQPSSSQTRPLSSPNSPPPVPLDSKENIQQQLQQVSDSQCFSLPGSVAQLPPQLTAQLPPSPSSNEATHEVLSKRKTDSQQKESS
ncbi:fork head domain-containing protein [Choanephora cucurbitarum]|nr:fork head domain-containing protein [Choanephora cucurbitarum]